MGTHISRVKSVDLDSWTDEQLKSILSWGNARANKYWESKLAPGHVPSEAKIENFIRTKYELKRWVMDGPMPNPASLDADGDDDVPLSIVKEKQNIERKESVRKDTGSRSAAPQPDLIGGDDIPPRASTVGAVPGHVPPKSAPAPPKAVNTKDSLLGLDFLGETPAAPPRPSSTASASSAGGQSRPDLKQSILSLYASAPRPQAQPQHSPHASSGSFSGFGGMQSPTFQSQPTSHQSKPSGSGGLDDAFASLSFGNSAATRKSPPPKDAFAGLANMSSSRSPPQPNSGFSNLGGGSFFDSKPAQPAAPQYQPQASATNNGFGMFGSTGSAATSPKPTQSSSAALGDLFDWSSPAPQPTAAPKPALSQPAAPTPSSESVFNLSASQPKPAPAPVAPASNPLASMNAAALGGSDVWGNAWSNPEPAPAPAKSPIAAMSPGFGGGGDLGGWGGSGGGSLANQSIVPGASGGLSVAPKVAADEEFGGWASSTGGNSGGAKPAGGFGNDDLFSNVWQ